MTEGKLNKNQIKSLRTEIDLIDDSISVLLQKRFECAKQIGQFKMQSSLSVKDEQREREVFENVVKNIENSNEKQAVIRIYKTIIQECRDLQK